MTVSDVSARASVPGPFPLLVINGPNLGHIGQRLPEVYGRQGMDEVVPLVERLLGARANDVELSFFQSNGEGAIIDRLEAAKAGGARGIVLNAGAYTHTSLAIADCLEWLGIPVIEVHISNVFAREDIRHSSHMAKHALGVISGFGLMGYALAVLALHEYLSGRR
ncbi:MAG: 3-dehydroquinate dehydratase [Desulfovibrio sp.]|jgi:3-dehydroquinate dehydratase-2|nr:3-dehydroquinate dehydratase [Desulfovibrio sp.]